MLSIGPHVPDPLSGSNFMAERFLAVARGLATLEADASFSAPGSDFPSVLQSIPRLSPTELIQVTRLSIDLLDRTVSGPSSLVQLQSSVLAQLDAISVRTNLPRSRLAEIGNGADPTFSELFSIADFLGVEAEAAIALYPSLSPRMKPEVLRARGRRTLSS
jgi:hypothetical protein